MEINRYFCDRCNKEVKLLSRNIYYHDGYSEIRKLFCLRCAKEIRKKLNETIKELEKKE
jgi:DNA-directed RNA polymerase subunit RPC12/RpoP